MTEVYVNRHFCQYLLELWRGKIAKYVKTKKQSEIAVFKQKSEK